MAEPIGRGLQHQGHRDRRSGGSLASAHHAVSHGRVIRSSFVPPWWLRNPHLQTLWPVLLRRQAPLEYRPDRLSHGLSRIYDRYLLRALLAGAKKKSAQLSQAGLDVVSILQCPSIREFDERLTAPLHGFSDAIDYYTRCSSRSFLRSIEVPTLILHAADDPFMSDSVVPQPEELSASVTVELSQAGGHVGFVAGAGRYWLEERIPEFLTAGLLRSPGSATE